MRTILSLILSLIALCLLAGIAPSRDQALFRRPSASVDKTTVTALPSTLALSCTWDREAALAYGRLLAEELLALDRHVPFGPSIECGTESGWLREKQPNYRVLVG
jgi:beta-glucosidase-like glycosyl hydrolase